MGRTRKVAIVAGMAAAATAVAAAAALGGPAPPPLEDGVEPGHGAAVDVGIAPDDAPGASDESREIRHYVVTASDSPHLGP